MYAAYSHLRGPGAAERVLLSRHQVLEAQGETWQAPMAGTRFA